jgi:transposase-like protein
VWLWRAVGDEGVVVDVPVQKRRDARVAIKLMRRLKNQGPHLESMTIDCVASRRGTPPATAATGREPAVMNAVASQAIRVIVLTAPVVGPRWHDI